MKYIIMCGGNYTEWEIPRQLSKIRGEEIVARTIRLLRENGIKDIAISSNNPIFEKFGVQVLKHENNYTTKDYRIADGDWFNAFYPTDEPACYIFGDVVFSPEAIKTIIDKETIDIDFFGSKPPYDKRYIKPHEEPFALKVINQKHLHEAIEKTRELKKENKFWRNPIMWELWTVIKKAPLQTKRNEYTADYTVINDYTCDVDRKEDVDKINFILGGGNMVKVETIVPFTLSRFEEIKNTIERKGFDTYGKLYVGDTFNCTRELYEYLTGNNYDKKTVVKLIEVIPEPTKEELLITDEEKIEKLEQEEKPKKKTKKNKK